MKKATANSILIHAFGACSCLLAVTVPGTAQQAEFPVDADGFRQLRIAPGLSKGATVLDVLAPFMEHFPGGGEGRPRMTLTIERIHGNVRFDLTETGFGDNSVAGEQHRGTIIRSGKGWEMIELGVRPICARGSPSGEGRCP